MKYESIEQHDAQLAKRDRAETRVLLVLIGLLTVGLLGVLLG